VIGDWPPPRLETKIRVWLRRTSPRIPETKIGNDCRNPFEPANGGTCDPTGIPIHYARFKPGGYILKR